MPRLKRHLSLDLSWNVLPVFRIWKPFVFTAIEGHFCFRRRHGLSAADMIGYLTYDEPVDRGIVSHYAVYLLVTN